MFSYVEFLHTFSPHFLLRFIFLAYECTFVCANHIIYKIGYLEQTGKKCRHLDVKYFLQVFQKMQENRIS